MLKTKDDFRRHLISTVLEQVARNEVRRTEAIAEFFSVAAPGLNRKKAEDAAGLVPPLLPKLYEKWAGMFADRLLETASEAQIADLCQDTDKSRATVLLVYIMFMESERMEQQVAKDLAEVGLANEEQAAKFQEMLTSSLRPGGVQGKDCKG